jgi:hypothetical protein
MHLVSLSLSFVLLTSLTCDAAKVLFFFGFSTYSHRISVWPLATRMAEQGHHVTFYQPFIAKRTHPKIKEFCPKTVVEIIGERPTNFLNKRMSEGQWGSTGFAQLPILPSLGLFYCEALLNSPELADFLLSSQNLTLWSSIPSSTSVPMD